MANSQHEPTMEEILASIRKIISEDPPGGEGATNASASNPEEPDVLDLTQEVHIQSATVAGAPAEPEASAGPSAEAPPGNDSTQATPHSSEGIFSERTRKALNDAFEGLEPVFEKAVREAFDPALRKWLDDNAATLIDRMKPVISEWLDMHFPALLEDAVRNEVARAVMARGRR
jgi:cell pole-organizing protein PopZ